MSLTSLAQQQAGGVLVSFGTGTSKNWLNARSIRMLGLNGGTTPGTVKFQTEASGTLAVFVAGFQVTKHLLTAASITVLDWLCTFSAGDIPAQAADLRNQSSL